MSVPRKVPRTLRLPGVVLAGAIAFAFALAGCSRAPSPPPAAPPAGSAPDAGERKPTAGGKSTGLASYYATKFEGRRTASGAVYHRDSLTAAHRTLPFGTRVRVTRLATGTSVDLVVNDRGPFRKDRIIDVSRRAAERLDLVRVGVARVRVDVIGRSAD